MVSAIAANPDDPQDGVGAAALDDVIEVVAATILATEAGNPPLDFPAPSHAIAYGEDRRR